MKLEEMREFVEGLFLAQYMTRDKDEQIVQHNEFDHLTKKPFNLNKTITYGSWRDYSISVSLAKFEDSVSIRFVKSLGFKGFYEAIPDKEEIRERFKLEEVKSTSVDSDIILIKGSRENCKEFLLWLFKEIDEFKKLRYDYLVMTVLKGRSAGKTSNMSYYMTEVLKNSFIVQN